MIVKYTIDRKSLYNADYQNNDVTLLEGNFKDKIKLKTHLSVIYRIIKKIQRSEHN